MSLSAALTVIVTPPTIWALAALVWVKQARPAIALMVRAAARIFRLRQRLCCAEPGSIGDATAVNQPFMSVSVRGPSELLRPVARASCYGREVVLVVS